MIFQKILLVVPYNDSLQNSKKSIRKNKDVAGVIVEPILGNMGLILPENYFLKDLRKITKEQNDIPLIFDEIITGFRISAPGGAQENLWH